MPSVTHDPIPALKRQVAEAIKLQLDRHYDPAAAMIMQTERARVSNIRRGRLQRFSLESLIRYASRLGIDVELLMHRRRFDVERSERAVAGPGA